VQACLTKPFDIVELLDALEETWERLRLCTTCGRQTAERDLRVFAEGARTVEWALCASCWELLEMGFRRGHPRGSLESYLRRPGFCITDSEVHAYLRVGQA
jgi:hypothetical protein